MTGGGPVAGGRSIDIPLAACLVRRHERPAGRSEHERDAPASAAGTMVRSEVWRARRVGACAVASPGDLDAAIWDERRREALESNLRAEVPRCDVDESSAKRRCDEVTRGTILLADRLDSEVLESVASGDVAICVVRGFVPNDVCTAVSRHAASSPSVRYEHEVVEGGEVRYKYYGVDRIGEPLNLTFARHDGPKAQERYFSSASRALSDQRQAIRPLLSPIDQLRLELDEVWPLGAKLARVGGRRASAGIIRVMRAEHSSLSQNAPHFDQLPDWVLQLDWQLAANCYTKMPSRGGALTLWPETRMANEELYRRGQNEPCSTSSEPVSYTPERGDLVLINSRNSHAVTSFSSGLRISVQSFVGRLPDGSLALWS